jgi:molybdate transport system permease protein
VRAPRTLAILAALAVAFVLLPVAALLQRAPWGDLWGALTAPAARTALRVSMVTSLIATAVAVTLGVPLAWALARVPFPGRSIVRAVVMLPVVLPPVVGGVALLLALGRRGLVGQWLDEWFGVTLPFTTAGAVVAQAFVAMPFLVLTAEAGFRAVDPRMDAAAATLGAGPWYTFRRVTLPLAAPAVAAGTVLAWARALGEFGATITFAGNAPGETQTLPLAVFLALEVDPESAVAMSVLLLAVSLAVLVTLRDRWLPRGAR